MSYHFPHHLKRLQHDITSNLHISSNNSHTNSIDPRTQNLNDEILTESIQNFTVPTNHHHHHPHDNNTNNFRPV